MTDLRQLAEHLDREVTASAFSGRRFSFGADNFERILREHHEELIERLADEARSYGAAHDVDDGIRRVLEGGGQAAVPHAERRRAHQPNPTPPAAPDQKTCRSCGKEWFPGHACFGMTWPAETIKRARTNANEITFASAIQNSSDHIHQTNEESDEQGNERRGNLAGQESSDDGSCRPSGDVSVGDGSRASGGVPELADKDTGVVSDDSKGDGDAGVDSLPDLRSAAGSDRDPVQVTNYDAEAEAQAREGVWVTAGDEVRGAPHGVIGFVVGKHKGKDVEDIAVQWDGFTKPVWTQPLVLRTLTGQPVLGFREPWRGKHPAAIENTHLSERIAELERELEEAKADAKANDEAHQTALRVLDQYKRDFKEMTLTANSAIRERDEARAERELARRELYRWRAKFHHDEPWVRLDDVKIEWLRHTIAERWRNGNSTWPTIIDHTLRDLRDGKLEEANDE